MAEEGMCYKVGAVGEGLKGSFPMDDGITGKVVKALEDASEGSLDVIDVLAITAVGKRVRNVYSFQLEKPVACPVALQD